MWIIIYGDLLEGIQGVIGLFDTETEAEDYAECHNLGHFEKFIFQLDKK